MMDGAEIVSLADRGRPHAGEAAFSRIMGLVFESSNPALAGLYIMGGIAAWLAVYEKIPEADIHAAAAGAIAEERARQG